MNQLLHNVSWTNYLGSLVPLMIGYYGCVGWKYYRGDLRRLIRRLSGHEPGQSELPGALYSRHEAAGHRAPLPDVRFPADTEPPGINGETSRLRQALRQCIASAKAENHAPVKLIAQLKDILEDYPGIVAGPARQELNAFLVDECKKTGAATLNENEVDRWWRT